MTRAALAAGLAVLGLVGVCVAVSWPAESPLEPQPGGQLVGDSTWAWIFLGCAAGALACYAAGLWLLRRAGAPRAAVLALAVAIQVAPLAAPLLLSSDAWAYWSYGRVTPVHDGNPYVDTPSDFPDDPASRYAGEAWQDSISAYGPAFTLASEPAAVAAGTSPDAAAWIFKSLAALALLAATVLAARLSRRPALAAAFVGWNPVLALHFAGGGHNDAWMAALVVAALVLGAAGRRELAGAAWVVAAFVKWLPLLLLPLRAVEARRSGRPVGHLGFAAAAVIVVAAATIRYGWHWLEAVGPLARNVDLTTRFAIPARLEQAGMPETLALVLAAVAFAAAYAWLVREAWRGRARLGLAAALLLLAVPYLAPWYLVWTIPLAAAEDDETAQLLGFGLSAYLLPQTVPV